MKAEHLAGRSLSHLVLFGWPVICWVCVGWVVCGWIVENAVADADRCRKSLSEPQGGPTVGL